MNHRKGEYYTKKFSNGEIKYYFMGFDGKEKLLPLSSKNDEYLKILEEENADTTEKS